MQQKQQHQPVSRGARCNANWQIAIHVPQRKTQSYRCAILRRTSMNSNGSLLLLDADCQTTRQIADQTPAARAQDENSHLCVKPRDQSALEKLLGHMITCRIAVGPRTGPKAFTLPTLPGAAMPEPDHPWLAKAAGFSLRAGVGAAAHQRHRVDRLCRYNARPAIDDRARPT